MRDDERLEQSIKEILEFGRRRPGWLGWAIWGLIAGRALLVLPVLLAFYAILKMAQTVMVIGGGLLAVVLALGLGYIFLMAFLKFAAWAVS